MAILFSCIVFLALAVLLSLGGMKMYVRPREAMERVAGTLSEQHEAAPTHPSLVFRDMMNRLGGLVPASPKDVTVMQKRLIRAGFRQERALKILYGAKGLLGILVPVAAFFVTANMQIDSSTKVIAVFGGLVAGFFGPNEYVRMVAKRRQKQNRQHRPPNHPTHRHMRERHLSGAQKIVQAKVADRLNHSGQHKSKRQNQRQPVVRAAKTHQRVRRIAEAQQRAAYFEIKISCVGTDNVGLPGIQDGAKVHRQQHAISDSWQVATVLAEEPGDLGPIPHNIPQLPDSPGNTWRKHVRDLSGRAKMASNYLYLNGLLMSRKGDLGAETSSRRHPRRPTFPIETVSLVYPDG